VAVPCFFCVFPFLPLHLCFLAKNINKTIEHSYFQNTKCIRKQEGIDQRNKAILSKVLRVKTVSKLTGLAIVEFVFVSKRKKRAK
jgi:hypothetical protein